MAASVCSPLGFSLGFSPLGFSDTADAASLPPDLWLEVLSRLMPNDLLGVQSTCKIFSDLQHEALRKLVRDRWPGVFQDMLARVQHSGDTALEWWKLIRFLQLRDQEQSAIVNVSATFERSIVQPRMRQDAVVLLLETCKELRLGEDIGCRAVRTLDHYLQHKKLQDVNSLQPLTYACLRAALLHAGQAEGRLEASAFLDLTSAYLSVTPLSLLEATRDVQGTVPPSVLQAPSPATFQLCLFALLALSSEGCRRSDLSITFTLSRALLDLALLDPHCASLPPSLLAASTISFALRLTHQSPLPPALLNTTGYAPHHLLATHAPLHAAHLNARGASFLRTYWARHCAAMGKATADRRQRALWGWIRSQISRPMPFTPDDLLPWMDQPLQ